MLCVIHLLEHVRRCLVGAVKDDIEFLPLLHLLQQRPSIFASRGELADFDFNVVSGRSFDQLLQANQSCMGKEKQEKQHWE